MKTKKVLNQTVKDIGMFSAGSVMLGAGAVATSSVGGNASGLATMGTMMPALGSLTMMKSQVGMVSSAMDVLPKQKRKRK